MPEPAAEPRPYPWWRLAALAAGPALAAAVFLAPPPAGLAEPAWRLVGVAGWMVIWWLTAAVPIPATALVPLPVVPLAGIAAEREVAASYAHPLIFLFLGGFLLAGGIQRSGLHRRIALGVVRRIGTASVSHQTTIQPATPTSRQAGSASPAGGGARNTARASAGPAASAASRHQG
jgi:sodium-dependent dicarboxylate transporter 2/3/5